MLPCHWQISPGATPMTVSALRACDRTARARGRSSAPKKLDQQADSDYWSVWLTLGVPGVCRNGGCHANWA